MTLPNGTFLFFYDIPRATVAADIQAVILARTGIEIPLERIDVRKSSAHVRGMISLSPEIMADLLTWALSEDTAHGAHLIASLNKDPRLVEVDR
jgi:hypothetical protein